MNLPQRLYPWQHGQWQQLSGLVAQDLVPHALMLVGPAEIGKGRLAQEFARLLLCLAPLPGQPCGRCKTCALFEASTHPDFTRVTPEEEGKAIRVDQIRELADFATRTASMGGRRVVIVEPAEAMNINAANAFLKTLEEPGSDLCILLVVHEPGRILPTIRSRCRIFPFPLPDAGAVTGWLGERATHSDGLSEAMELAGGRPLRALRFLETGLRDQLRDFRDLVDAVASGRMSVLEGAKILQGINKTDAIEWFQYLVYDRLREASRARHPRARLLFRFLDRLNILRQRLLGSANPNPQLDWEEILMDWKSVIDLFQDNS